MQKQISRVLLFDFEKGGELQPGQAILVFEDGSRRRVRELSLYPKEETSVRKSISPKPTRSIRSRSTRAIKHRAKHIKHDAPRKRAAVYQA